MEIILQIISALLCALGDALFSNIFRNTSGESYFARRERKDEETARQTHTVKMSKGLTALFTICIVIINAVEIVILACKPLITDRLGFDYLTAVIIWSIVTALDDVFVYFMFTKAAYDDEKIIILKPFQKAKTYYFDDIESYTFTGNLKVTTAKGGFVLFNTFAGTETLRGIIINKFAHKNGADN